MGVYHQAGVVPAQLHIPTQIALDAENSTSISSAAVFWWKTYPPPLYLLGHNELNISTQTLMGASPLAVKDSLLSALAAEACHNPSKRAAKPIPEKNLVYLVLPLSAPLLASSPMDTSPAFTALPFPLGPGPGYVEGKLVWVHGRHINFDDIDIPGDGPWGTVKRVLGRRGLGVWKARKVC